MPDNTIDSEVEQILTKLENEVARDVQLRLTQHRSGRSPKSSHAEAAHTITNLIAQEANKARLQLLKDLREYAQTHNSVQTTTHAWQILDGLTAEKGKA